MEATTNLLDSVRLGYTVQVDLPTGPLRFWSGDYTLTLEQVDFIGGAGIFNVIANKGTSPRLRMLLGTEAFTEAFRKPVGPAKIVMQPIGSLDDGQSWSALDFPMRGRLSGPRIRGKEYEVDIVPERYYPIVRTWSDEDHRSIPGNEEDTIFSQQRELSDGKVADDFGHVPLYDREIALERMSGGGSRLGGGGEEESETTPLDDISERRGSLRLSATRTRSTENIPQLPRNIVGGL